MENLASYAEIITNLQNAQFINILTIFVLACFIGFSVVWKVTPALHTPLMSVTNAISGIILIGAMIIINKSTTNVGLVLGFLAAFFSAINIFGGFAVTHRMLQMFKKKG